MPTTQPDSRPRDVSPDEATSYQQGRRNSRFQRRSREKRGYQWIAAIGTALAGLAAILGLFMTQQKDRPTINFEPHIENNNGNGNNNTNRISVGSTTPLPNSVPVTPIPAVATAAAPSAHAAALVREELHAVAALPSVYEKYIDPRASRQAGKMNVAISIQGGAGEELAPLEEAMRQGLIEGGNSVIPLFRDRFRIDGIGTRLFDGDPTLAGKLKLRDHCDALLLGSLRFVGPAQEVASGLYVREIVLDVHQIDPVSGQIGKSLEIREKGGGSDAQLSTINALSRLKDKIETSISEWTWT
jgi:hypothetical protein